MAIGPWGDVGDVFMALLPIGFLLVLVLKKTPTPATTALPLSAAVLWILRFAYFQSDPNLVNAALIDGILAAVTPTSIAFGAITMFNTMEYTKSLPWLVNWMKSVSHGHPVAEIMIIGLCFTFILEGAAGFGIPAALGTPILVTLGYDPVKIGCTALIMNSIQNAFGAVGVGLFFGFRDLTVPDGMSTNDFILEIGFKAGILIAILSLVVPPLGLSLIVPWRVIKRNAIFIYLSIFSIIIPMFAISFVSYNLPTLLGGFIGLLITMFLSNKKFGLNMDDCRIHLKNDIQEEDDEVVHQVKQTSAYTPLKEEVNEALLNENDGAVLGEGTERQMKEIASGTDSISDVEFDMTLKSAVLNLFPLWGSVIILVIIRTQDIRVFDLLQLGGEDGDPRLMFDIGTLCTFRLGPTLRLSLIDIFGQEGADFDFPILSTPWFLPFVLVSLIQYIIFRKDIEDPKIRWYSAMLNAAGRMKKPAIAFMGATALSQLLVAGETQSPAFAIGDTVARAFKEGWVAIAPFIGGLGAFFSGSLTISNLTFGTVQQFAAQAIGVSETSMLGLQHAGGCVGNMIAIGNIILVKAVLGGPVADVPIGIFVRKNIIPFLISIAVVTASGFVLVFAV